MSRYDVLTKRTGPKLETTEAPSPNAPRRGNPAFRQFSAYIPAELYRKVKVQLAERDMDLSEAVQQALTDWIQNLKATS